MTTPLGVDDIQTWNNGLVRKVLKGSLFIGDFSAATVETIFAADGGLAALPSGYYDGGLTTTDGLTQSRDMSMDETEAWQTTEVVRSDSTSDKLTFKAVFEETNRVTLALNEAKFIADVPAVGTAVVLDREQSVDQPYRRALLIGQDGVGDQAIFVGCFYPKVKVSDVGDEQWMRGGSLNRDFTFAAYYDVDFGTSRRYFIGGPGWTALGA